MDAIPARLVETGSLWDRVPGLVSLQTFMEELGPGLLTRLFGSLTRVMDLAETEPASEPVRGPARAAGLTTMTRPKPSWGTSAASCGLRRLGSPRRRPPLRFGRSPRFGRRRTTARPHTRRPRRRAERIPEAATLPGTGWGTTLLSPGAGSAARQGPSACRSRESHRQ